MASGGKGGARAPDPYATANAQLGMNTDAARLMANMNRGDTFSPFGSVTQRQVRNSSPWDEQSYLAANPDVAAAIGTGAVQSGLDHFRRFGMTEGRGGAPAGFDPNASDRWETRVELNPQSQQLLDSALGTANAAMPGIRAGLEAPIAYDDPDARNRATNAIFSRLEPQFARDREALEGRLLAQGFQPGTEAYRRAADELNRTITDARIQGDAAGMAESRAAAAFANQLRGQRVQELGALFGLGPGNMPQQMQLPQVGVQTPDLAGMLQQQYQQRVAQQGSNMGAFAGLGGAALGAALGSPWLGSAFGFGAQAATGAAGR